MINFKKWFFSQFRLSSFEISFAGILTAMWIVSAAFININFGFMRVGIYIAFAILVGLTIKPLVGIFVAIISDNIQLLIGGNVWSWMFALLPIIIILSTVAFKQILNIKNQNVWWLFNIIFSIAPILTIIIILIVENNFVHSDRGKILDITETTTKTFLWIGCSIFILFFFIINYSYSRNKKESIRVMINISLIVVNVFIISSWLIGTMATIIWLNQIGGTLGKYSKGTSYYWKMFNIYLLIRILKSPISIPIHIFIVLSIYKVWIQINISGNKNKW